MKRFIKGYVYWIKYEFSEKPILEFSQSEKMGEASPDWVLVGPHDFWIECPDDFDPRPLQVAALDECITKTRAEFQARINELQEQKSRLLCIENSTADLAVAIEDDLQGDA